DGARTARHASGTRHIVRQASALRLDIGRLRCRDPSGLVGGARTSRANRLGCRGIQLNLLQLVDVTFPPLLSASPVSTSTARPLIVCGLNVHCLNASSMPLRCASVARITCT